MIKLSRIAARIAALVLLAIITFSTLSPIQMRPHIAEANVERGLAYVLLGLTLAISFPNRLFQTVIFVVGTAGILEILQIIDPGRHARFLDALVKAAAGIMGVAVGWIVVRAMTTSGM
jgi:VanZ like family